MDDFDGVQEDWDINIPLQLGEPRRKPGYVHTKVEGDKLQDQGYFVVPGQGHGMRAEPLVPGKVEYHEPPDQHTEEFRRQVTEQLAQQATERLERDLAAIDNLTPEEGIKHDEGKDRWDLLPPSIAKVVEVYTIGAAKYDDDNWAKGMGYRRIFGAMMRHAWKWFWGESYDPQDGQHHLASVAWACLTLMHYEDEGVGTDDRAFKPMEKKVEYEAKPYGVTVTMGGNEAEAWAQMERNWRKD